MNTDGIVAWFARNHVAANLLMAVIVVGGWMSLPRIKREVFPEFRTDTISVSVVYPGASPEEVEQGICLRVEEEVASLEGVERVRSTAAEGAGTVTIEALDDADMGRLLDDVKAAIDAIDNFPLEAEEPVVREVTWKRQTLNVAVSGDVDERSLRKIAERVRDDLTALPDVTQAELVAVRPYEVSIEVSEQALRRHGLSFDAVATAVRRSSLDLPGGSVKTAGGEILLRALGQAYAGPEFADLVLLTRSDGTRVVLGDVATVIDAFAETDQQSRFDGAPCALVQVYRVGDQDALAISAQVNDYCAAVTAEGRFPPGVSITPWLDYSELLKSRQDLLLKNGFSGFVLVFAVLALFLRFKLAIWVSIGIPISFLGALMLMPWLGTSLNMLSLFAFILVLGIVVDDAIVVGENVYAHSERGKRGLAAAIDGTREVALPVTFAILTTVAAFLPMAFVPGNTGPFWAVIPAVVIPTLLFSMVESKLILPAHLRHIDAAHEAPPRGIARVWGAFQGLFAGSLQWVARRVYGPSVRFALRQRYLTVAASFALLIVTLGLVAGGHVPFVFFPAVDGDNVVCNVTMPQGTPVERTTEIVRRIEAAALALRDELAAEAADGTAPIRHVLTSIGEQPYRKIQSEGGGRISAEAFVGAHYGEVNIQLAPSELRTFSSESVADRWRERVGTVFGATELTFSSSLISVGADMEVKLYHPDIAVLETATARLRGHLEATDGVIEIRDSLDAGKLELELRTRPAAETLGVSHVDLARQVRQGFYGEEAQRIQRGRDDVKVMVRYPESERRSLHDVERMRIRTAAGDEIPFATVAEAELGRGPSKIERTDRARTVTVSADVDAERLDVNVLSASLSKDVLPQLAADLPGLRFSFEGEQREQAETLGGLVNGFLIALLLIYVLLAVPFKSYLQPMIVMTAIPFGLVGAILGHMLLGLSMSILSIVGIVALAGVVVNDSLVLVDFVNRRREEGDDLLHAVADAGVQRFRPILLTSLTTFAGLTPLLLERSVQALFLVPMAVSLGFGVLFSTFITLVFVPASYLILDDLGRFLRWLYGRRADVSPAG